VQREGLYRPESIYQKVTSKNITLNNHHLGISPQRFHDAGLSTSWKITSTNVDLNGKSFVSTLEPKSHRDNPVYGVQFHPEKNAFEYGLYPDSGVPYEAIDHSREGVAFSLYMAGFLVDLARNNIVKDNDHKKDKYTKSNLYPMVYTYPRKVGFKFEEIYVIPPATFWGLENEDQANNDSWNEYEHNISYLRKWRR